METAHIPAVFSKQGWLRPYIVQGSTLQYRLSVGPGGWTMVALERAADVLVPQSNHWVQQTGVGVPMDVWTVEVLMDVCFEQR